MNRPIEVMAGLVVDRTADGRLVILVSRRRQGRWEFPGGKIEPGETEAEALARELKEELGVEVAVGRRFMTLIHHRPQMSVRLTARWCRLTKGRPVGLQGQPIRWVEPADLADLDMMPADRVMADELSVGRSIRIP